MKKFCFIFALVLLMGSFIVGCDNETESVTSTDYDRIISLYRRAVESIPDSFYFIETDESYAQSIGIPEEDIEDFENVFYYSMLSFPSRDTGIDPYDPANKLDYGYEIRDLNLDGVDELILLTGKNNIIAIYSHYEGKPIFLKGFWNRCRCVVDTQGRLRVMGSSGADYSSYEIYEIAEGGSGLEMLMGYGTDGIEWVEDTTYETIYYHEVDGEKVRISEDEFEKLVNEYNLRFEGEIAKFDTTPLFTNEKTYTARGRKIVLASDKEKKTWREPLVKLLGDIESSHIESLGLFDVDFDGVPELMVNTGGGSLGAADYWVYDLMTGEVLGVIEGGSGECWHVYYDIENQRFDMIGEYRLKATGWDYIEIMSRVEVGESLEAKTIFSANYYLDGGYDENESGESELDESWSVRFTAYGRDADYVLYTSERRVFEKEHFEIIGASVELVEYAPFSDSTPEALADVILSTGQEFVCAVKNPHEAKG